MKKFSYLVLLQKHLTAPASEILPHESYRLSMDELIKTGKAEEHRISSEVTQKNGTSLLGGLTQFLATPLKSDRDDILRLIKETIDTSIQQLDAAPMLATADHTLWSVMDANDVPLHRQSIGLMKRLLKNGKEMLKQAGCTFGKQSGSVYVSLFSYAGFATVHSIMNGISTFNQQKIMQVVHASVSSVLYSIRPADHPGSFLVILDIDRHDDTLAENLKSKMASLFEQYEMQQLSVLKHTFPGLAGSAFQIRFGVDLNKYKLGSIVESITAEDEQLTKAIAHHTSMVVLVPAQ